MTLLKGRIDGHQRADRPPGHPGASGPHAGQSRHWAADDGRALRAAGDLGRLPNRERHPRFWRAAARGDGGQSTGSVNEAVVSGKHCIDWYPAQRRSSDGEIWKQIPTSSGTNPERPSPRDIGMSQWPWARLERRAVCAERCPYGSGRRSAYALLTPFPMARGFVYLAAVVDWFSRRVLAWRLSITMEAEFCIEALDEALARHGRPEIFNTDQGSQFTS